MDVSTVGRKRGLLGSMAALMGLLLVPLLVPGTAQANLVVRLQLEHVTLHRMEPVVAFVSVSNQSGRVVVVDPSASADSAQLKFRVRLVGVGGDGLRQPKLSPTALGVIEPGETRRFMVRLSDEHDFTTIGGYLVQAEVHLRGLRFESHPQHMDVVTGLPLTSASRMSPFREGTMINYRLNYLARGQSEHLFLSVDESPAGINYGVFHLGRLVRVFNPVLEVTSDGNVTVVHQSGPGQYTRSLLTLSARGMRLLDQSHERHEGRPGADGEWTLSIPNPDPADPAPAKSRRGR